VRSSTCSPVFAKVLARLTTEQYLALLDAEHGPFDGVDPSEKVPLIGLQSAIQTLVARGAIGVDFKAIYCEGCKFNAAKSLDRAVFDGAYVTGADFSHVSLRGASFKDADIGGANFFGADLSNADLRIDQLWPGFASKGFANQLPLLECAKLGGADLSGQPLVLFKKAFDTSVDGELSYSISLPRMISVELDTSTKLDNFRIVTAISINDQYLKKHRAAPEVKLLTTDREGDWGNPLAEGWWGEPDFRRIRVSDADADTIAMKDWPFRANELKHLGKDAFMLRGFVDQPVLKRLPLYSQFVDVVGALNVPKNSAAKAAQARSDKAATAWATMKPLPCNQNPRARTLLFNLGTHSITYVPE